MYIGNSRAMAGDLGGYLCVFSAVSVLENAGCSGELQCVESRATVYMQVCLYVCLHA